MSGATGFGIERVRNTAETIGYRRVVLYSVLVALLGVYLAPLEAGFMTSIKTSEAFTRTLPFAPPGPDGFTGSSWRNAVDALLPTVLNSIILAVPAAALSALFGSLAAYGLTNLDWKGQLPVVLLFVAGIFIPYQAVLVPLFRLWGAIANLRIVLEPLWALPVLAPHHADLLALIITHTAYGIPITTILFRGYYQKLPQEMFEAARLDGASVYRIYRKIVLPLSIPMFAVTLIYQFTQVWNDLLFALVIIPSGSGNAASAVVTMRLNSLGGSVTEQIFNLQMAGAFVAALPTLLVYVLFGEKFAKGVAGES